MLGQGESPRGWRAVAERGVSFQVRPSVQEDRNVTEEAQNQHHDHVAQGQRNAVNFLEIYGEVEFAEPSQDGDYQRVHPDADDNAHGFTVRDVAGVA